MDTSLLATSTIKDLEEDLVAIEMSIAHWERMRDGAELSDELPGVNSCDLCLLATKRNDKHCTRCPVAMVTGHSDCRRTPYNAAVAAWRLRKTSDARHAEWVQKADTEVRFLRSVMDVINDWINEKRITGALDGQG